MRMTMGIAIFHIDVPLAPDGVTSKTVFPDSLTVISIEFYLGSQTRLIFAFILTEEFWKNCFRRHAVWSQRDVDMKNEYPHPVPNSFKFVRFLGERPHIFVIVGGGSHDQFPVSHIVGSFCTLAGDSAREMVKPLLIFRALWLERDSRIRAQWTI
ncbi:hypothetical protein PRIPAC_90837 [Pristionchus pacificus]|uniref:Uncharacterized protein n=1 Tax=Pristionchus pacificus TaxID=54126 RepID=A0A2A6B7W0_PRIPA|nr:hypothetical protein PRIPAC_90837 [Pristionchus pacificus]|eukprot:PDM61968.1 hypothetical protein PRIPAC_51410 [Pristionchus pacificus]